MAEKTILIVGDSLSAAYGLETKSGWVRLLQQKIQTEKLPYKIVNASISGDTTSNGLARLPAALKKHNPDITIIELGANDGLRGLDIKTIKQNLTQMVILAKQAGSQVLILGLRMPPNYGLTYTQQFQQLFIDIGKEEDVKVVPNFLKTVDEDSTMFQQDNLHPTVAAQEAILNNVWEGLAPMLR